MDTKVGHSIFHPHGDWGGIWGWDQTLDVLWSEIREKKNLFGELYLNIRNQKSDLFLFF